ncbi:Ehmt1, partial [Symbiodinium pilosum]
LQGSSCLRSSEGKRADSALASTSWRRKGHAESRWQDGPHVRGFTQPPGICTDVAGDRCQHRLAGFIWLHCPAAGCCSWTCRCCTLAAGS